jgi:hypothetical protein
LANEESFLDLGGTGAKTYEELIKLILDVFSYSVIKDNYDHDMDEALNYVSKLLDSDPKQRYGQYSMFMKKLIGKFRESGISSYTDLLSTINTKEKAKLFLQKANITIQELMGFLSYLRNWVLPKKIYLSEFVEKENRDEVEFVRKLSENNVRFNLDLFELGQTKAERKNMSKETSVPEGFLNDLLSKVDFNRTPYCRGKCAIHYFNMGFKTLEQLANTSHEEVDKMFTEYQKRINRNMKSALDPYHGSIIAKALPKIVKH